MSPTSVSEVLGWCVRIVSITFCRLGIKSRSSLGRRYIPMNV